MKVKVINEKIFIEYTKKVEEIIFTITNIELNSKYEFDMYDKFFYGRWVGEFEKIDNKVTKVVFTEYINIKNPLMATLSYFVWDLKKIQNFYITDLKNKLKKL